MKYLPEINVISEIKKRVFHQSYPEHRNNPRFLSDSVLKIASPEFPKSMINWKHQETSRQNSLSGALSYPWGRQIPGLGFPKRMPHRTETSDTATFFLFINPMISINAFPPAGRQEPGAEGAATHKAFSRDAQKPPPFLSSCNRG